MKDSITETTHIRCARAPLAGALTFVMVLVSQAAMADEAGVSFWLPGFFGSLAAAPQQPGWSLADIYYHDHVSAGGDVALAREFEIGKVPLQFSGTLSGSVKVPNLDIDLLALSYVSATPVLGGQLAVGMMGFWGRNNTTLSATLNGTITPPGTSFTRSDFISDTLWGFGDLFPLASLRWNQGVNNWMVYMTGDIPVGAYQSTRLANMGIGHGAIDGGVGYTYLNQQTGHEFSAVLGFTGNFENTATNYTNGVDMHLDWGVVCGRYARYQ